MIPAPIPDDEAVRLSDLQSFGLRETPELGYDDVTFLASYICETPVALVTMVESDRQWFKASVGTALRETTREDSFCSHLVGGNSVLVVEDTLQDARFVSNPLVQGDLGIRFYAGAPLVTEGGQVIGSVCVIDNKPRTLRPEQIRALEALSRQVMARMELGRRMLQNQRASDAVRTAEKLAAVGRMASAVAHEINNPLQSVTNLLFMVDVTEDGLLRGQYLKMATDELARVTHIVTQSLRFHHQSSNATRARLGEVAESVLSLFRTRLSHAGARVCVRDTQTSDLLCFVDDVRQVLSHLFSNALDALALKAGGTLHVRIRDGLDVQSGRTGVFLTIADTGTGILPEAMQRLFEPFNTTKGARGTGLGLWVSRNILAKHGARLTLRSRHGVSDAGTIARIFLPNIPTVTAAGNAALEFAALPLA